MAVHLLTVLPWLAIATQILLIDDAYLARSRIDLRFNGSSEMQCPQTLEIICIGTNLSPERLHWKADGDNIGDYEYDENDTFPFDVESSVEGFEITVWSAEEASHIFSSDSLNINSTLIARSEILNKYSTIESDNTKTKNSIPIDFNCVEVHLQVNDTVEGNVCPAGLNFTAVAMNVKSIDWYLEDKLLIQYSVTSSSTQPQDLCTSTNNKNKIFADLCSNGGSLIVDKVTANGSRYNVVSTLITTGTYIFNNHYLYVKSGSNNITSTISTNYNLSCGTEQLALSVNSSNDDDGCEGVVEFVCTGTNVPYFYWIYNDNVSFTENYTYSPSTFPVTMNTDISGVNYTIVYANTIYCHAEHFNFKSIWIVQKRILKKLGIKDIACEADDLLQYTNGISKCKEPWYYELAFLDVLPWWCNVGESTSWKQNIACFAVTLLLVIIILSIPPVIIPLVGWVIYYIGKKIGKRCKTYEIIDTKIDIDEDSTGSIQAAADISFPNGDNGCIVVQKEHKRRWRIPFFSWIKKFRGSQKVGSEQGLTESNSEKRKIVSAADQTSKAEVAVEISPHIKITSQDQQLPPTNLVSLQKNPIESAPLPQPSSTSPPPPPPQQLDNSQEDRDKERKKAEKMERERAIEWSKKLFSKFDHCKELQDLGSRLQKFWLRRRKGQKTTALQFTVKISKKCPISLEDKDIRSLMELFDCLQHPHLLTNYDVACNEDFISIVQDFVETGSIRDFLFNVSDPSLDWLDKYKHSNSMFLAKNVATCSRQILGAVLWLYDLGFPTIGQIHIGNVFVKDKGFILGGYENVLLGYRTSIYSQIVKEGWLNAIDVIMFGRMIYEMYTGEILSEDEVLLNEDHFSRVKSEDQNIRDFLEHIFSEKVLKKKDPMRDISSHPFIQNAEQTEQIELTCELTPGGRDLLQKISAKPSGEQTQISAEDLDIMAVAEKLGDKYVDVKPCKIGWRPHKAWAKAKSKDHENGLLSAIKIPYTCPVFVKAGLDAMKSILKRKEKFLVRIFDLHYLKINDDHILVIFQEIFDDGSLKDKVYEISPWTEGGDKYEHQGHHLPEKEIAAIGCQILNISLSLGFMDGLKSPLKLQFLHTGNIFERKDSIAIGGLENMILGCRPPNYMKFNDYVDCIDTLMFGHLIFELASGKKLTTTLPTDKDYKAVSSKKVKAALKTIFEEPSMNFKKILDLGFFSGHQTLDFKMQDPTVKLLLQHVRKGKRRDQDDTSDKIKYIAKKQLAKLKFRSIGKK